MKTNLFFSILLLIAICFSCQTKQEVQSSVLEQPVQEQIEVPVLEPIAEPEPQIEEVFEPEPEVELVPVSEEILEYERSVNSADDAISIETFTDDKAEILKIIEQLARIMKTKDYSTWLKYVTPESIDFWSNPQNLIEISAKLPIKNYRLKNLKDYFEKVFIPSRQGRVVNEIRYISKTHIKAVQSTETQDIIYYYFEKIDGTWLLQLDTNT